MINYASKIKERVTMLELCERYGIAVNRAGFARCVFHSGDNTASMKVYPGKGGFYCFACQEHGDVIAFVQKYFELTFQQAIAKINEDMGLNLPIGNAPMDEKRRYSSGIAALKRKKEYEAYQKRLHTAQDAYNSALDEYTRLDLTRLRMAPTGPEEALSEEFVDALKNLPLAKYQLDEAETELMAIEREERR